MGIFNRKPNVDNLAAKKDVKGLIKALTFTFNGVSDMMINGRAAEELGKIGDKSAVEPLIQAFKDGSEEALAALVNIGAPSVEPLSQCLSRWHGSPIHIRRRVVWALGSIKDAKVIEPLIQALADIDDVRGRAQHSLISIGLPAVQPLIQALRDINSSIRFYTVWVLEQIYIRERITDTRVVESLTQALKDESSDVRRVAAEALGEIKDARAIGPLIAILKDEDYLVQTRAERALWGITGQSFHDEGVCDQEKWQKWWEQSKDTFINSR